MKKSFRQRRGSSSSKPGGCFVQHAVTLQERRKESSSSDSDSSDSESSYKTSSQLSPRDQNYNVKFDKSHNYNPTNNEMALSANAEKDEDSSGLSDTYEEDLRNICANINVPELVKYFDGLEVYNGQILTGRATKEKLWETTTKKPKTDDNRNPDPNNGKKYNNDHIFIHQSSDHTYSRPPKSEKSDKTFVNPRRDDFFDNEMFRNVCTNRRRRKDEPTKSSVIVGDERATVHKETPGVTLHDNTEESTRRKTNNPNRKYTSVVGPMPHNYRPVIDTVQNDHFNVTTRNNHHSRLHLNPSVSHFRNGTKLLCKPNPKSSNINPQSTEVTGGTYVSQRDRGDLMGYYHQQKKDYTSTSACLEDHNKYQTQKWPNCDPSSGLYTQPCSHIGPKDRKNNLLTRPYCTIPQNEVLLRDIEHPKEDNNNNPEVKKDDNHNLTFDITSEECSNSVCLRRKQKDHQCQINETEETSSKISASKLSFRQSPTRPNVLSIRIDINMSHPNNVYSAGSKSFDLQKDERKRKTGKNP